MFPIKLIPASTKIDFIGKRWVGFVLSIVLILGSFGLIATKGLNFGIDFTGGIVIDARFTEAPNLSDIRSALSDNIKGEIALQTFGADNDILIRVQANEAGNESETVNLVKSLLEESYGTIDYRKVDFVGPQVSSELLRAGSMSLIFAILAILVYIWFRFEWQFGIGAVIALLHDAILTVGFFSLMNIEFNLSSIAAILTIIGYSINDSVVIFDRIRENLRKYKKMELSDLLNLSINDTLSRTLITAGTTIAALIALVLLGGDVIKGFSLTVLFGIVIGTYSSIYVAAPTLIHFNIRKEQAAGEALAS